MKTYLDSLATVVLVGVLAATPLANARSGGMPRGGASRPSNGGFNSWRGSDGGHFHHDRFHNQFSFFFFGGPYWYPYCWPPYYYYDYYDYPPPYDYYYYDPPVNYYGDSTPGYSQYD